jgi:hypothetical protein
MIEFPGPPIRPSDLFGSDQIRYESEQIPLESIGIHKIRLYPIRCCLETGTRIRIGTRRIFLPEIVWILKHFLEVRNSFND